MSEKFVRILGKIIYVIDYIIPKRKDGVIFYSYPDFSDNCRAMYERLQNSDKRNAYKITWVVRDVEKYRRLFPDIKFVKHKSLQSLWNFCRAKYIIRTHSFWDNIYVKKRQIMCVAFHGMMIKGYHYSEIGIYPRNGHDHFCVTSPLFAQLYSEMFNSEIERFDVTGFPRNDYMFQPKGTLLEQMNLTTYNKIILWMPTFRGYGKNMCDGKANESGLPTLEVNDIKEINSVLEELNFVLLLKMHPWAMESINGIDGCNMIRVIEGDDIPAQYNLYHLIGCVDAMISDYSSVWGDYLLMDKPIGFAFDDLEEYQKSRYIPLSPLEDYMPGFRIHNKEDMLRFLYMLNEKDPYKEQRDMIRRKFLSDCDGNSSERFLKSIGLL